MTGLQVFRLLLAGIIAGIGLPMLGIGSVSHGMADDPAPGFVAFLGLLFLIAGCVIAIWAVLSG